MLFNSFRFLVFFVAVATLHYVTPHRFRWMLLLAASYMFYMAWRAELILLLLFSTAVNFVTARAIALSDNTGKRKRLLTAAMAVNFGLLFIFKYLMFISGVLAQAFDGGTSSLDIILPMGISFYTFQAAAYTIDVYRKDVRPQTNFFKFSLFITFFPQLVAGPIERTENLLPQLFSQRRFRIENIAAGCKHMSLGFFKKVVVADRLSILVNRVYNAPAGFGGPAYVIATVFFAFQIYCDFSGYSDIAVGCAKVLGIDLMQNFRQPYIARSVKAFWRRWHVSLSTWFKDYVYIPLGGSSGSNARRYGNLLITFLASGLWHGANWTFVVWGGLNGLLQIVEDVVGLRKCKLLRALRLDVALTFALICFTWIFFRANTLADGVYIARGLFSGWGISAQGAFDLLNALGLSLLELGICVALIIFLWLTDCVAGDGSVYARMERVPSAFRLAFYFALMAAIFGLGVFYNAGQFIYFQF